MSLSMFADSQDLDGPASIRSAVPLGPLPERLPWQTATLVILSLSLMLWGAVGIGIARLMQ